MSREFSQLANCLHYLTHLFIYLVNFLYYMILSWFYLKSQTHYFFMAKEFFFSSLAHLPLFIRKMFLFDWLTNFVN